jgi:hypothetical protein
MTRIRRVFFNTLPIVLGVARTLSLTVTPLRHRPR